MHRFDRRLSFWALLFYCFLASFTSKANQDSLKVLALHSDCASLLASGKTEQALLLANEALALCETHNLTELRGITQYYQACSYQKGGNSSAAINHYLQAIYTLEKLGEKRTLPKAFSGLASIYLSNNLWEKAIQHYRQATRLQAPPYSHQTLLGLGISYKALQQWDRAEAIYKQLEKHPAQELKALGVRQYILGQLSHIAQEKGNIEEAINYGKQRLQALARSDDHQSIGISANNLGFISQKQGDNNLSQNYFLQALGELELAQQQVSGQIGILLNLGVTQDKLRKHKEAQKTYRKALALAQEQGISQSIARAQNYLAASYFVDGDNGKAKQELNKAIKISEENNHSQELANSYRIYSEVYRSASLFRESQKYDRLLQQLENRIKEEEKARNDARLQALIEAERQENEYLELIAEKERQALNLKQLGLEKEKLQLEKTTLEQQQEALTQQQALQEAELRNKQLEGERFKQQLQLAKERLEAEQQQQLIANLEASRERQRLELAQKELEEKERQKAIALLESEKQLQTERLEKEAAGRRFNNWLFALFGIILLIIGISLLQQRRASKKLRKQSEEIKQKNEELQASEEEIRQNMEELETTQEKLKEQKNTLENTYLQLEAKNEAVIDSIRYANTIQGAILPTVEQLNQAFQRHFIIYLPKDLVSGDFYWMSNQEEYTFIAVADCTGHGVPGALMSMIGHSLLNQIVNEKRVFEPREILDRLNVGIIAALKQQESNNTDGMDISLCRLLPRADGTIEMYFAGAKTKFYLYRKGDLQTFKGDSLTIGGNQTRRNRMFSSQEIQLEKGDTIYLLTDGYIDAANSKGRRLGSKKLKQMLVEIGDRPMEEQRQYLLDQLQEHQINQPQRDDITILGFTI